MNSSFACVVALLSAGFASADTVVSVAGATGTGFFLGGSAADEVLVSSWTQTGSYTNMSISAELGNGSNYGYSGPDAVSVYLTNQIGPGTTVANQLASTTISPSSVDETDTLFSGLSLGAGTYYLVMGAPGQFAEWYGTDSPTITADTGVTDAGDYHADHPNGSPDDAFLPASTFIADSTDTFLYTVTGDAVSATPEPSSLILIGLAGAFLVAPKLRSRR